MKPTGSKNTTETTFTKNEPKEGKKIIFLSHMINPFTILKGSKLTLNASASSLFQRLKKKKNSSEATKVESKTVKEPKIEKKRPAKGHSSLLDVMINFTGTTGALATATAFTLHEDENSKSASASLNKKSQFIEPPEVKTIKYQLNVIDCERCGKQLELYTEDTLGHLILICSSIIQRECGLVAPYILEIILGVTRHDVKN